jgi:hypothetical protein
MNKSELANENFKNLKVSLKGILNLRAVLKANERDRRCKYHVV